jgi:hypothetical protein
MAPKEDVQNYIHEKPSVHIEPFHDSVGATYSFHWETDDGRNIYLYITLALKKVNLPESNEETPILMAHVNFDSEEVKKQGSFLRDFCDRQLSIFSLQAIFTAEPCPIICEVVTNQYSQRLFQENKHYTFLNGKYYAFYVDGEVSKFQ